MQTAVFSAFVKREVEQSLILAVGLAEIADSRCPRNGKLDPQFFAGRCSTAPLGKTGKAEQLMSSKPGYRPRDFN